MKQASINNKTSKSANGFWKKVLIIGTLAILIITGLLVLIYAHDGSKLFGIPIWNSKTPPTLPGDAIASEPDPYAGWKEYCSPQEKSCFRYPPDWFVDKSQSSSVDPKGDGLDLISKSGTEMLFTSTISGLGGGCDPDRVPNVFFQAVQASSGQTGMYIITLTHGQTPEAMSKPTVSLIDDHFGVPHVGDSGTCIYYPLFRTKHNPNAVALFSSDGWVRPADMQTVLLMLNSYHY